MTIPYVCWERPGEWDSRRNSYFSLFEGAVCLYVAFRGDFIYLDFDQLFLVDVLGLDGGVRVDDT